MPKSDTANDGSKPAAPHPFFPHEIQHHQQWRETSNMNISRNMSGKCPLFLPYRVPCSQRQFSVWAIYVLSLLYFYLLLLQWIYVLKDHSIAYLKTKKPAVFITGVPQWLNRNIGLMIRRLLLACTYSHVFCYVYKTFSVIKREADYESVIFES